MSALDPIVSVRSAYLPTGPREEYRGERPVYRRDVEQRGSSAPSGVQGSMPARPTRTAAPHDQISTEKSELLPAPSPEPSISQEASAVQPTTTRLNNPAPLSPFLTGPVPSVGKFPQNNGEYPIANKAGGCPPESLAVFTEGSQKVRILAAVAHGARTTTEITQHTGLLREQVHKAVGWLVKKGELLDVPSDEERTVQCASPGGHKPADGKPFASLPSAESKSIPPSTASPTGEAEPSPQTAPALVRGAQGSTPSADELIDQLLIDQLEAAATEALSVLRDAFSRLADLARENAEAKARLIAVQKLLGGGV